MPEISCDALQPGKFPSLRKKRPEEEKERKRERERETVGEGEKKWEFDVPDGGNRLIWNRSDGRVRPSFVDILLPVRFVVLIIPNVRPRATSSRNQKFRAPVPRYRSKFPNPIRLFILARVSRPFLPNFAASRRYFPRSWTQSENLSEKLFFYFQRV